MENKICKNCGNNFFTKGARQIYCSSSCREIWYLRQLEMKRNADYTIFARDDFSCVYCGKSPIEYPGLVLNVDHVIPVSQGGNESIYNLITSCNQCNFVKGGSLLSEAVYDRIIERNRVRSIGLSDRMKSFTERVFYKLREKETDEYNKEQKR